MRRLLVVAVMLALLGVVGVVIIKWWVAIPRHHITWESYEQIQLYMTAEEVERILGVPPGEYPAGAEQIRYAQGEHDPHIFSWEEAAYHFQSTPGWREWVGIEDAVGVVLNDQGLVVQKHWGSVLRQDSILQRLRRLLPW
jgi:hypothetical protein